MLKLTRDQEDNDEPSQTRTRIRTLEMNQIHEEEEESQLHNHNLDPARRMARQEALKNESSEAKILLMLKQSLTSFNSYQKISHQTCKRRKHNHNHIASQLAHKQTTSYLTFIILISFSTLLPQLLQHQDYNKNNYQVEASSAAVGGSTRYDPISNGYSGLTFSFDPRLDKRVEMLHFEHWLSIIQQTSGLMHESLAGRAHLASIQVLIPYKWRHNEWPVIHKPGVPIMSNRLLKYADSDVIVGFEEPVYRETPFAIQHDECAMQGHNIHMPISFLESSGAGEPLDVKLKARMLLREFASHRFGLFKESGFRNDPQYPPFNALPGANATQFSGKTSANTIKQPARPPIMQLDGGVNTFGNLTPSSAWDAFQLRGFDPKWNECAFETQPANGMPAQHALQCAPFLVKQAHPQQHAHFNAQPADASFNLMSADLFSHTSLGGQAAAGRFSPEQASPLEWADLLAGSADGPNWHFCGDQFAEASKHQQPISSQRISSLLGQQQSQGGNPISKQLTSHAHNPLALNKQNIMCNERPAMDIIRMSDDFRRSAFSGSTFNRLPETSFHFVQEMPPRVILGVEYSAHLYQAHRLEHGILEAAIGKWLAYDLIADSEFGLVLFGQSHSHRYPFKKLDSSLDARPTLYSPPIDPFDEQPRLYSEQELLHLDISQSSVAPPGGQQGNQVPSIIKGTCSLARLLAEAQHLSQQGNKYDDQGVDYVVITSGLFIEDEAKIEDLLKDFKATSVQLNLIIYPSSMLFDTKSHPSQFVVLDQAQSEAIVRSRVNKLLTIKRLTNAKIHLVKEHVDANNDVRMSTLLQFYQIFQHISSGHSWDQTSSMIMLNQQQIVEATRTSSNNMLKSMLINGNGNSQQSTPLYKLQFQFQLDNSLENELIVGFIDPKSQSVKKSSGKRFSLRNLQLRSPTGQLVLTDPTSGTLHQQQANQSGFEHLGSFGMQNDQALIGTQDVHSPLTIQEQLIADQEETLRATNTITDSALFPYRSQLGLAGFHLKSSHLLSALNNSRRASGISGTWTLSAVSEEPLQASAIAMARVNPSGDSITANCWIQSYGEAALERQAEIFETHKSSSSSHNKNSRQHHQQQQKLVKVFVQLRGAPGVTPPQETFSRMEVEDEAGNIVQNVNLLDDGLGVPDMTRGDGIHSQFVQLRQQTPGFYRIRVEVSGNQQQQQLSMNSLPILAPKQKQHQQAHIHISNNNNIKSSDSSVISAALASVGNNNNWQGAGREPASGQDTPCCGSYIPASPAQQQQSTRFLTRQLYCGTFYLEPNTRLGPQQPPRINTLAVQTVDQESRRVTLRWSEPQIDINQHLPQVDPQEKQQQLNNGELPSTPLGRYELRLFTDREAARRAFDAKQEVGFLINEQLMAEGAQFPNVSLFGGQKDLTFRVPYAREGIYYVAMKVFNNNGADSPLSNIVQFYIRANQTQLSAESVDLLYGQPTTMDADGNVYDKNGELVHQRVSSSSPSSGIWSNGGTHVGSSVMQLMSSIDALSISVLLSLCTLLFCLLCVSLVACLAGSSRSSHRKSSSTTHLKRKSGGSSSTTSSDKPAMILASNGSSLASTTSQCASSQQSELASSTSVQSDPCEPLDIANNGKHALMNVHNNMECGAIGADNYIVLSQPDHQEQHHMIQNWQQQTMQENVVMSGEQLYQRQQHHIEQQQLIQHNMINGYAYATVNQQQQSHMMMDQSQQQHYQLDAGNQQVNQSWTTDVLQNHYDKVKQARERNENPPVLRVSDSLDPDQSQGLPIVQDLSEQSSYLLRRPSSRNVSNKNNNLGLVGLSANPLNQQLQQQLNSVLRNKRLSMNHYATTTSANNNQYHQQQESNINSDLNHTSPALEGLTDQLSDLGTPNQMPIAIDRLVIPPPPPHYVYDAVANDAQQAMLTEPSIYSQLTNLQQPTNNNNNDPNQYYANQWNFVSQAENNNKLMGQDQNSPNNNHQYLSLDQPNNAAISDV